MPARVFYIAGCVLLLFHIPLALHYAYHWQHKTMIDQTARQTLQITGVNFRGGPYINYVFAGLWLVDAIYWQVAGDYRYFSRSRFISISLHVFLMFVAFNATVIFAGGPTRVFAMITIFVVFTAYIASRQRGADQPIKARTS